MSVPAVVGLLARALRAGVRRSSEAGRTWSASGSTSGCQATSDRLAAAGVKATGRVRGPGRIGKRPPGARRALDAGPHATRPSTSSGARRAPGSSRRSRDRSTVAGTSSASIEQGTRRRDLGPGAGPRRGARGIGRRAHLDRHRVRRLGGAPGGRRPRLDARCATATRSRRRAPAPSRCRSSRGAAHEVADRVRPAAHPDRGSGRPGRERLPGVVRASSRSSTRTRSSSPPPASGSSSPGSARRPGGHWPRQRAGG